MTLAGLSLPEGLVWTDEFGHDPLAASTRRTVAGREVRQHGRKLAGRPVTLAGGDAWLTRTELLALRELAEADPETPLSLTLEDGRTLAVYFRHEGSASEPALSATPLADYADPGPGDYYTPVLRLVTA